MAVAKRRMMMKMMTNLNVYYSDTLARVIQVLVSLIFYYHKLMALITILALHVIV